MSDKDNQKVFFGDKKVSKGQKKTGVEDIFSRVSDNYDLMNDLMSVGMHRLWKSSYVNSAAVERNHKCLDLAAGTGDISKILSKKVKGKTVYLCDQNSDMIDQAKERSVNEGFINKCHFAVSSAEKLPYSDSFFDHVFISFGFRNFSDKPKALKEIMRVLKEGGQLQILEFSKPEGESFNKLYDFYSFNVIPTLGELVSGDKASYEYLVKSIRTHENQEELVKLFNEAGFSSVSYENIFKGVVSIHKGIK